MVGPADDNELLAVQALRLDPDPAVARGIGSVGALGDGAFQAEPAGLRAKTRAVAGDVVRIAQAASFLPEQAFFVRRFPYRENQSSLDGAAMAAWANEVTVLAIQRSNPG